MISPFLLAFLAWLALIQAPVARVAFLDVGQGDATLIVSPEGKRVLVDGGRGQVHVATTLRGMGIDTLDLVVATHADADHTGGLVAVLETIPVRAYLDNGRPHTTATYRHLMEAVERSRATYLAPTARTITVGSVQLRVLPPPADAESQNNASVGLVLEYGAFRALLVGDAEQAELQHFIALGVPRVAVLKASHHGARNGVTPGWIQVTRPRVVVISVGAHNPYGHPDPMALRYYQHYAEAVYRTDLAGTVTVAAHTDGSFTVTGRGADGAPATRTFSPPEAP
jgi:competence protein ComEC